MAAIVRVSLEAFVILREKYFDGIAYLRITPATPITDPPIFSRKEKNVDGKSQPRGSPFHGGKNALRGKGFEGRGHPRPAINKKNKIRTRDVLSKGHSLYTRAEEVNLKTASCVYKIIKSLAEILQHLGLQEKDELQKS